MKTGRRKAQERLSKMHTAGKVKRFRISADTPFIYYMDRKSGQIEHLLSVNWVYVWFNVNCNNWRSIWYWQTEIDYKILRCDALCGIKNSFTGEVDFYFVELDRSNNRFDKVEKYNKFYEDDMYTSQWWVKYSNKFPTVICVTENINRMKVIKEAINEDNANDLRFEVYLLEDMIKKIQTWE